MKTFVKTLACALAVSVAFLACSSEDGEGNVFLSNKSSYKEQKEASDNGYCPLLPYTFDPRIPCQGGRVVKENPDGSIECQGLSVSACQVHGVDCDGFSEAERDSLRKVQEAMIEAQEIYNAWQKEAQRMYRDSTRTATVTFSENQTFIQLSSVFVDVDLELVRLKDSKVNDTLYIEAVPGKNGDYGQSGGIAGSGCPISLDITLNHVDENIAVIVYGRQLFQVKSNP